jgi:CubicO group peptidase (beta-lactamase class C family)
MIPRIVYRWPLLALLGSLSATAGYGQTPDQVARIEQLVTASMSRSRIPAMSIAISLGDSIAWERGFGMADLENFVPATPGTVYRIASNAKPITALAVMQLVEQGRIDLDQPIVTYVPDYPRPQGAATVRQLLTHTGGVRHHRDDAEYHTTRDCPRLRDALPMFAADSLLHPPGERVTYSTYAYVLLGLAVERASGMSYIDYLKDHIFRPAGMLHSYADRVTDVVPGRAGGYGVTEAGELRNAKLVNTSCRMPGGGLLSTAGDMVRLLIATRRGNLVSSRTAQSMQSNQLPPEAMQRTLAGIVLPPGYVPTGLGYGWAIGTNARRDAIWHGGNQQGATSVIYYLPERRLGLAILSNLEEQGEELKTLADAIAAVMVDASR